jgi:histidinol-phosphate phosphatase family protein
MSAGRAAVFLDRDGTINVDTSYVSRPERVSLMPGAAAAIAQLNAAGVPVIVVSNQSGIGRGYFSHADYELVQRRIEELLAEHGAHVDATYICPHAPDGDTECECRKPGALLYRRAAEEHELDLAESWYVGDRWRDIAVAEELGGKGVLVPTDKTPVQEIFQAKDRFAVATTLRAAVDRILGPQPG